MHLVVNGESRQVADGATLSTLIEQLEIRGTRVAVEVNGRVVTRDLHATLRLEPDDRVEIVAFVGGGC